MSLASEGGKINTVEQAFKYADVKYQEYCKILSKDDVAVQMDNIDWILINKIM